MEIRIIDLFAGIGGIRLGFKQAAHCLGHNMRCVFSSEIDKYARKTYAANFGEYPAGDITQLATEGIPNFDVLCAGFPCQAFSIAGRRLGFEDTRGTLFFEIYRLLSAKRPKAFLLENVKGLRTHNGGKTLATILSVLREDLGYYVPEPQVLNARDFGVPQQRERIVIVGFRKDVCFEGFEFPTGLGQWAHLEDILETKVDGKYYLSDKYHAALKRHKNLQAAKGNHFGFCVLDPDGISNTLMVGGMGKERNLIHTWWYRTKRPDERLRRLTPREWARLQGFEDSFLIPVSDTQAYRQFGNSVAIPMIAAVAERIIEKLGM